MGRKKTRALFPTLTSTAVLAVFFCFAVTISALIILLDESINRENRIQTGVLSASLWCSQLLSPEGTLLDRSDLSDPHNKLFGEIRWYPGKQCVRYLQVENTGSLPLSYTIVFSSSDIGLGERLTFTIRPLKGCGGVLTPSGSDTVMGTEMDGITIQNPSLMPNIPAKELFEITCRMEDWDTPYGLTSPDLRFTLDITLLATQTGIPQPGGTVLASEWKDLLSASPYATVFLTRDIHAGNQDLSLSYPVSLNLNGHTLTVRSLHMEDDSRKGMVEFLNGQIKTTGSVPGREYGVVIDTPETQVRFSKFTGTVFSNGTVYEDGLSWKEQSVDPIKVPSRMGQPPQPIRPVLMRHAPQPALTLKYFTAIPITPALWSRK